MCVCVSVCTQGEGTAEVGLGGQSNWTVSDEEERKNSAERRGISRMLCHVVILFLVHMVYF